MAKEQNLSLNPTKISGNCGRLMCCLKNEEDAYEYLNSKLPNVGDVVIMSDGKKGEVIGTSVLKQLVKVLAFNDSDKEDEVREAREVKVSELRFNKTKHHRKDSDDAEAKKLEALEKKESHHLED